MGPPSRPPRLPQVWLCSRSLHLPVLTRCWRSLPSSRPGPQHGARPLLPRCPQTARTRQAGAIDLTEGAGAVVGGWGWPSHHRASKDIRHNGMFLRQDLETRFAFLPWKSAPPLASDPCRRVSGEADGRPWLSPRALWPARPGARRASARPGLPSRSPLGRCSPSCPSVSASTRTPSTTRDSASRAEPARSPHSARRVRTPCSVPASLQPPLIPLVKPTTAGPLRATKLAEGRRADKACVLNRNFSNACSPERWLHRRPLFKMWQSLGSNLYGF